MPEKKYCILYMQVLNRDFEINEGKVCLPVAELNNFVIPGYDDKIFEVCAIAFYEPGHEGRTGHYFTYVKYQGGWIDLNCLGKYRRKKVTMTNSYVNNDFLKTLKVKCDSGYAYACEILLKVK